MTSQAYEVLRASSRRLLAFIEQEIARQGGGAVTIYQDQFVVVGSIKVIVPGLSELHALGLLDVERHPKRYVCKLSERWRQITLQDQAQRISNTARTKPRRPVKRILPEQRPASVSA